LEYQIRLSVSMFILRGIAFLHKAAILDKALPWLD
jgi:hypothetical protein